MAGGCWACAGSGEDGWAAANRAQKWRAGGAKRGRRGAQSTAAGTAGVGWG